jgi:hypothetical protein
VVVWLDGVGMRQAGGASREDEEEGQGSLRCDSGLARPPHDPSNTSIGAGYSVENRP